MSSAPSVKQTAGERQQQAHADVVEQRAADGDRERETEERHAEDGAIISAECALSIGSRKMR